MKRRWVWGVLLLSVGLGFFPWPVAGAIHRLFDALPQTSGWILEVDQARWIPFRHLELEEMKLTTPLGGRAHLVKVRLALQPLSLWRGTLPVRLTLQELRIDPGSWGIREPLAQEILSAAPVAMEGDALFRWAPSRVSLDSLWLDGKFVRLKAAGWVIPHRQESHFHLEGNVARDLLEAMAILSPQAPPAPPWEPFQCTFQGALPHPQFSFTSSFLSFTMNPPQEAGP